MIEPTYYINSYTNNSSMRSMIDVHVELRGIGDSSGETASVTVSSDLLTSIVQQFKESEWKPLDRMCCGLFDAVFTPPDDSTQRYLRLRESGFYDNQPSLADQLKTKGFSKHGGEPLLNHPSIGIKET